MAPSRKYEISARHYSNPNRGAPHVATGLLSSIMYTRCDPALAPAPAALADRGVSAPPPPPSAASSVVAPSILLFKSLCVLPAPPPRVRRSLSRVALTFGVVVWRTLWYACDGRAVSIV